MIDIFISTGLLLGSAVTTVALYHIPTQHQWFRDILIGLSYGSIIVALLDLGLATLLIL